MKRIVYISDSAIPSSSPNSVHVMKMCQAFSSLGHEVYLLGKNTTACMRDVNDVYAFYSVKNNFRINIYPRAAFTGSGAFFNVSLAWRAIRINADIIYTRSITAAFFLLLYGKSVVFEVHEPFEVKGWRLKYMFRFIVRHPHLRKLVVISHALKNYYVSDLGLKPEAIFIAHDGADPFSATTGILNNNDFKIGYVGSLYPGKGMEILLPLAQACPTVQFHVIGGSEQQVAAIKDKSSNLTNIFFHGFKRQMELPAYISSFDAVIAPYTSSINVSGRKKANNLALWMSPLKIFEYMSSGKPIITSDLPVIREILDHGTNALLCDPDNLSEWVTSVKRLMSDTTLRQRLSKNALTLFNEKYSWYKRAEKILMEVA